MGFVPRCLACLVVLFLVHGSLVAAAAARPFLTAERAIAAARHSATPGNSVTVLWRFEANADTRRVGDLAIQWATSHKIELFDNGLLAKLLRSGGYLLAETSPQANTVVATHLLLMGRDGTVTDARSACQGAVNLADARQIIKDTVALLGDLYSTPSTRVASLATRFYGGDFPDRFPDSLFTRPDVLQKLVAKPNEVRRANAIVWGYLLWPLRSALSMPAFAASPSEAEAAAEKERDLLKAKFLKSNQLDPNINPIDIDDLQSDAQLQERIELLTRLNRFLEDSLRREADPAVVKANVSVLTMPLRVDAALSQAGKYVSSSPPNALLLWRRLAAGGFAVEEMTWDAP